jgi:hypothetical protein
MPVANFHKPNEVTNDVWHFSQCNGAFLERGYDAVSLDDIVHHAGGSKASIYKYFGSKEGLFKAICDYRRELF